MDTMKISEACTNAIKATSPYVFGLVLVCFWFIMNYSVLVGETIFTGRKLSPSVSPEIVGRILGYIDSGTVTFLIWLYGSTKSSGEKDQTIAKVADKVGN